MLRGEVWLIDLDPAVGAEMRKTRPAVIVSSDRIGILPLKVVVPLTEWKERYSGAPWFIKVEPGRNSGLDKTSAADTFQVRSVAQQRFVRKVGLLSAPTMTAVSAALAEVLEIGP